MRKSFNTLLFSAALGLGQVGSAHSAAVIYEGFDYTPGSLVGAGGTTEVGLTGTWSANTTSVSAGSLSWGALPTSGGSLGPTTASQNRYMGARDIAPGALTGLLNDGTELWFSMIAGYGAGGNRTNMRLAFAFGDSATTNTNFDYDLQNGTGVGFTIGRFNGTNGKLVATSYTSPNDGNNGFANNIFDPNANTLAATFPGANTNDDIALIVGRITWGAGADTIDIFLPGTDLALGAVHSSLTVNVDQSNYDTISMQRGDIVLLDEIRFGASYDDVIGVPEPSSSLLLALGGIAFMARRRR